MKQTKDETLEEQDIKLREVKQFHKVIDEMLADCIEEHAPISFILQTHFKQVIYTVSFFYSRERLLGIEIQAL